jgi:hypothetical protein
MLVDLADAFEAEAIKEGAPDRSKRAQRSDRF